VNPNCSTGCGITVTQGFYQQHGQLSVLSKRARSRPLRRAESAFNMLIENKSDTIPISIAFIGSGIIAGIANSAPTKNITHALLRARLTMETSEPVNFPRPWSRQASSPSGSPRADMRTSAGTSCHWPSSGLSIIKRLHSLRPSYSTEKAQASSLPIMLRETSNTRR